MTDRWSAPSNGSLCDVADLFGIWNWNWKVKFELDVKVIDEFGRHCIAGEHLHSAAFIAGELASFSLFVGAHMHIQIAFCR